MNVILFPKSHNKGNEVEYYEYENLYKKEKGEMICGIGL